MSQQKRKHCLVSGYIRRVKLWKITRDIVTICLFYYDDAVYFNFKGKAFTDLRSLSLHSFHESYKHDINGLIFNLVFYQQRYRLNVLKRSLSYYLSINCSLSKVRSIAICYSLYCKECEKFYIDSARLLIGKALRITHNNNCNILLNNDINTLLIECNFNVLYIEYYTDDIDDDTYFKFITDYNYKSVKLKRLNKHEIKLNGKILQDLIYGDDKDIFQTFMKNDDCWCFEHNLNSNDDDLEVIIKLLRLPKSIMNIKIKYEIKHRDYKRNKMQCQTGIAKLDFIRNKVAINMNVNRSELKVLSSLTIIIKFGILTVYGVDEEIISNDQWYRFGITS